MTLDEIGFQYSKDNHYRWGWGEDDTQWFNEPDYTKPFKMTMGRCTRTPKSFREECILATQHLCGQVDKHVYVGLSGGLDSQVVCLSLLEAKIPFTPCIILMEGNYNIHDVINAKEFCEKYNLTYKIFKIDMMEFYSKYCPSIVDKYKITNARTIMQLWLQQFVNDGLFIMGGGDVQITRYRLGKASFDQVDDMVNNGLSGVVPQTPCTYESSPTPILQHLISNSICGTTKYFMYSPELVASVLLSKEVESFVKIEDVLFSQALVPRNKFWLLFNYVAKSQLYANNWPELILKPKYHGFEYVERDREYKQLKRQAISKYSRMNSSKSIFIEYKELKEYFSTEGEQKIWYSNPLQKVDSSVATYLKNLNLQQNLKNELFDDDEEDLLDSLDW